MHQKTVTKQKAYLRDRKNPEQHAVIVWGAVCKNIMSDRFSTKTASSLVQSAEELGRW